MRLALFEDFQVGVLRGDEVVDVSHLFEGRHIPTNPDTAGRGTRID